MATSPIRAAPPETDPTEITHLEGQVGEALGWEPDVTTAVTYDGGSGWLAWVDPVDGPWFTEEDLSTWLHQKQADGLYKQCQIVQYMRPRAVATDPRETAVLIRELEVRCWHLNLNRNLLAADIETPRWTAILRSVGLARNPVQGHGPTAEIAICRAALKALDRG